MYQLVHGVLGLKERREVFMKLDTNLDRLGARVEC